MDFLLFCIFFARLIGANILSLFFIVEEWIKFIVSFFVTGAFFGWILFSLLLNQPPTFFVPVSTRVQRLSEVIENAQQKLPFFSVKEKKVEGPSRQTIVQEKVRSELEYWQELHQQQPTHRDILLNLSQLYSYLNEKDTAEEYLKKAQEVDPNYDYSSIEKELDLSK